MGYPNFSFNKIGIIILAVFAFLAGYILHGYKNLGADLLSLSQQNATSSILVVNNATSTLPVSSEIQCAAEPPKNAEYKLITNVDECLLNKLANQGWHIFQVGSLSDVLGYAADCNRVTRSGIDWILLTRDKK